MTAERGKRRGWLEKGCTREPKERERERAQRGWRNKQALCVCGVHGSSRRPQRGEAQQLCGANFTAGVQSGGWEARWAVCGRVASSHSFTTLCQSVLCAATCFVRQLNSDHPVNEGNGSHGSVLLYRRLAASFFQCLVFLIPQTHPHTEQKHAHRP